MKTLKPHPHVIRLLGCVTEYGKLFAKTSAPIFNPCLSTLYKVNAVCSCYKNILIELTDVSYYTLDILLSWSSVKFGLISISISISRRSLIGIDWVCSVWRSPWLPEKEPWIKWHLLQRPRYQTTNKFDVTTADEVCSGNCWWDELPLFGICKLKYFLVVFGSWCDILQINQQTKKASAPFLSIVWIYLNNVTRVKFNLS